MLAKYTDYQNNLLNQLAYCNLKTWKPGQDIILLLQQNGYNDLAQKFRQEGMTGLRIKDYANSNSSNGFSAIAFDNIYTGETGFTYRGTENLDKIKDDVVGGITGKKDLDDAINSQIDMIDNISTALTGDSSQARDAIAFFEKNSNPNGKNFLYGHSKGGELSSEVFAKYHKKIQQVHVINPQPINWSKLTPAQLAAFNSKKFDACVINGDLVSWLGGVPYSVRYIKNNKTDESFFGPHHLSSASYDENGNAVREYLPYVDYFWQGLAASVATIFISVAQAGYRLAAVTKDCLEKLYKFITQDIPDAVQKLIQHLVDTYEKVKKYLGEIKDRVETFINTFVESAKQWINSNLNRGYMYSEKNPQIVVNTYTLKEYAQRLQRANKRIDALDERMDSLYWQVGLKDLWNLLQADILVNHSWRLSRCVSYLNNTAQDFEQAEQDIINKL